MHNHDEEGGEIEGLIYRNKRGVWVADFDGCKSVKVDFCPWCGKELR